MFDCSKEKVLKEEVGVLSIYLSRIKHKMPEEAGEKGDEAWVT